SGASASIGVCRAGWQRTAGAWWGSTPRRCLPRCPGQPSRAPCCSTPSLMHDATGIAHRMRLLKPVLRELGPLDEGGSLQSLDALALRAREELALGGEASGLPTPPAGPCAPLRGRAGLRVANLVCVAEATRLGARKAESDVAQESANAAA